MNLRIIAEQRLWPRVKKGLGCWEWTGYRNESGHGQIQVDGKAIYVHRVVYETEVGPIGKGLFVRHTCDNPPCVRPDHLVIGTQLDNIGDAVSRGRMYNQKKTHCPKNHPYDLDNTRYIVTKKGKIYRVCRLCDALRAAKRRRSQK